MDSTTMNLKDLQSNVHDWLIEQGFAPDKLAAKTAEMLDMNFLELVTAYPCLSAD